MYLDTDEYLMVDDDYAVNDTKSGNETEESAPTDFVHAKSILPLLNEVRGERRDERRLERSDNKSIPLTH